MVKNKLLFSVTMNDCEMQVFRCPGKGGQKVNKTSSGVRIIHKASGARGESCEERSQSQNKRIAFIRMADSAQFKNWHRMETARRMLNYQSIEQMIEKEVDKTMNPTNLKIEVRTANGWEESDINND